MNNYFSLRKRGLALFVALMMCLSLLPGTALAAEFCNHSKWVSGLASCPDCGLGSPDKGDAAAEDDGKPSIPDNEAGSPDKDGTIDEKPASPAETTDQGECKHEYVYNYKDKYAKAAETCRVDRMFRTNFPRMASVFAAMRTRTLPLSQRSTDALSMELTIARSARN